MTHLIDTKAIKSRLSHFYDLVLYQFIHRQYNIYFCPKKMAFLIILLALICSPLLVVVNTAEPIIEKAQIQVGYHLWYSPDPAGSDTEPQNHVVAIEDQSTFYQVMVKAKAEKPVEYDFEYVQYPFGKQITSIGGMKEDAANNIYWMIYELSSVPDVNSPPSDDQLAPVGVDSLLVSTNKVYLFWRKKI